MPIAITEDHRALAETVSDFLAKHDARGAARSLLEAETEPLPAFWADLAALGWLGLHLPEDRGGSGFGLPELVVVVEELGRAVAPGPFVPTVIASAVVDAAGSDELRARVLPGLADGSVLGGVALQADVTVQSGTASGTATAVLGGGPAHLLVLPAGDDVVVVDAAAAGVSVTVPPNLDPTRRSARVTLEAAPADVIVDGRRLLTDLGRLIMAAEATGVATECTEQAAEYAKARPQFGRPIAMFQAVKHHCANMLVAAELATAAVWDAARAAAEGGDQLSLTAAEAADPGAGRGGRVRQPQHPGARRHRLHLGARRPPVPAPGQRARGGGRRRGRRPRGRRPGAPGTERARTIDLPPEAEPLRDEVRSLRRADQGPRRRGPARRPDRERLRDAALAQALRARGRRGGAARDRAGVRRGRDQPAPVRHHGLGHPDADPARVRGPGGPLGAARRCARRSSGASCSASPTPAATRRASRPRAPGSRAAGWSTARRSGPAAPTTRASAWPPSAPTPTSPSTRASPPW